MRKITKKSLEELAKIMPVLSVAEQRMYVAGSGSYGSAVSFDQYLTSWQSGSWGGGDVTLSDGSTVYQPASSTDPMYGGTIPDVYCYSETEMAERLLRYNIWFMSGMTINQSGSWTYDDFMNMEGSGSTGGSGNNSGSGGGGSLFPSKKSIELIDYNKFVAYNKDIGCMGGAVAILNNYGVVSKGGGAAIKMVTEARTDTKMGKLSNTDAYMQGIALIDKELDGGKPLIVGVDVRTDKNPNPGSANDHFVVITGRGYDENGIAYYTYMETASTHRSAGCNTAENRFYYNSGTSRWEDSSNTYCKETMTISDARPNK